MPRPPAEPCEEASLPLAETAPAALAAAQPALDPAALKLARLRVGTALFGPAPAVQLGRFRLLERVGAGGMGTVYAAYDPDLDRGVALKIVRVPAERRDAAFAEAQALARLSHPNVVPVHDVGLEGEHVTIVMEWVRGETLRRAVEGKPWRQIVELYQHAGAALAAAHDAGLVHRDFKPENALVGRDGRVRVVDFGLAQAVGGQGDRGIAGTLRYMAPEQAAG